MVKSVSNFSRNGLRDFLLQRLTAVYMALFLLGLILYLVSHQVTDFYAWQALFQTNAMRISAVLFLICLSIHTQIGLWTIATDYLKDIFARMIFLVLVYIILCALLIWGVMILWS